MTRPGEVFSLLLLCSLSSCASCEGIEGSNELRQEAADLRNIGIRAELAAAKGKSDDKPAAPKIPEDCTEITKELALAGGACALELVLAEKEGKECTSNTCPECVRLASLREQAKKQGC